MSKEALYYSKNTDSVRCELCPHNCVIKENNRGICGVRKCVKDEKGYSLISENYGKITAMMVDPVEKKPLAEFYPGSNILSVGSYGCNFKCSYCQNFNISQYEPDDYTKIHANKMVSLIDKVENNIGIAFTYNEPTVYYEYVLDVVKKLKEKHRGNKVVIVTNGYINKEPLEELLPYVDAMNIDIKGGGDYYKSLCFGNIEPVINTIRICKESNIHVEVTVMLLEGENTDDLIVDNLVYALNEIDPNMPVHLTRYYPNYKMNKAPTSLEIIKNVYNKFKGSLNNVYIGNLTDKERQYIME